MADIEKIKKLRSLSGAGFKDCNSALMNQRRYESRRNFKNQGYFKPQKKCLELLMKSYCHNREW